ncbi:uncharacterized protein PAC_19736 [Phialocephala subalpina]|uniref:Zn(2)-C6 fungal-type domain-containing protein n=1 Tax=Phialocephala subalpina TaxID=576137 RepID=A0A1L7XXX6_9HELO|nr:uncharacterized protein PAC_19736 [Phialocephala subalpina]
MRSPRNGQQPNTPHVRTRQGCWTCRRRRRKCDEVKPTCQNCAKKGLKCKYGIQLTFHGANLFELDEDEAKELKNHGPERYDCLQFVDGLTGIQEDVARSESNHDGRPSSTPDSLGSHADLQHHTPERESVHFMPTFQHEQSGNSPGDGSYAGADPDMEEISFIENGHANTTPTISNLNEKADDSSRNLQYWSLVANHSRDSDTSTSCSPAYLAQIPANLKPARTAGVVENIGRVSSLHQHCCAVDVRLAQELFKYYIDSVSPWLQLCQFDISSSTAISLNSANYPPLYQAILALAASQSQKEEHSKLGPLFLEASETSLGSDIYSRHEQPIVTRHLHLVTRLLLRSLKEWRTALVDEIPSLESLGMHGFLGDVRGAVSWLVLRFDIATTLISHTPLSTNIREWHRLKGLAQLFTESSHLQETILLSAEIVDFCQSTNNNHDTERWVHLFSKLRDLESLCPSGFALPLVSSQIGMIAFSKSDPLPASHTIPRTFPIPIFTSRASFYVSLLRHLTRMLLSQCKPRKIEKRIVEGLRTASLYAVQICGLSLSNPLVWSWDPVVVASLLAAGPLLSYSEQQGELLEHLKRLSFITGWKFGQELQDLEDVWKFAC